MTDNKDNMAGIREAREKRSLTKRRMVEDAINELKKRKETITFKSVAKLANVSRQYLYNNFKDEISSYRDKNRAATNIIDGIAVPTRTPDEARHIEALLRNKINKLKKELGTVRQDNARLKQALERERGKAEHFRQNWINAKK